MALIIGGIERFAFVKVESRSPLAALITPDPSAILVDNYWACNGHPCPNCGRETIYYRKLKQGIDLDDHPAARARLALFARSAVYSCPDCRCAWVNVEGRRAYARAMGQGFMPPIQVGPNPPVIH